MKKIFFVVFTFALFTTALAQWTRTNGPEGVAVSTLTNIDGTIYTGTEVNGVYASTDDGVTWVARNTGIETFEVTSIINKPGYIFAGTFGGGVYRSTDEGQTWIAPSNGTDFAVASMVRDDDYIFAATISEGVQRSSDNGATWEQKLGVLFGFGAICKSGNKVIASSSNYTLESTDHGETWSYITDLDGAIIFSYFVMGDTIFAGGQTKIYRSLDNGNNFTTINLNLGFGIVNISAFTYVNSTLYAATSYDGVYKSTDFGLNWIASNQGMGPKDVRALTLTDASSLIAGTHYVAMYRSIDLGVSWDKSVTGFPAGCSILSLLESETSVFAGTRDGVFRTDDNGDTWIKMGGTNDTTMYGDIWAMCEHNGVLFASMQLYFDATVYKSTDKGSSWIRCVGTGLPSGLSFIKGLEGSGNNLIAGTDEGIFYSVDGGDNWVSTNVQGFNIPGLASSENYVYAAIPTAGGVYRSLDNGVNWSVSLQSTVDYVEVAAIDDYAFAGAFFGGARYSSNYGSTWFASGGFPSDASVFALGPVSDGMILAGTDLAPSWIYVSFNNGGSYSPYSEGLFENASVEAFAVNDTFMFAGTDYNSVWRRLRPGVVSTESHTNPPLNYNLSQNYPNPFNPRTTIKYSIPKSGLVTLKIYNSIGEQIATLVSKEQAIGNYEVVFDATGLQSGVYFYRLQAGDFIQTKKMILMK
jgi:photosystem II stability/assembly factor-like uncharacterized protein